MKRVFGFLLLFFSVSVHSYSQNATANTATGIVKSENGELLSGVSIQMQNTATDFSQSTTTNQSGVFSFKNIPVAMGYRFIISYVGYQTDTLEGYEMKQDSRIALSVSLRPANTTLDKVVVIGYGSMRKKDLSAAVADVPDIKQVKERPVVDVANMIQGKVAGITVVSNGGHPNSTPKVIIRGVGSRQDESVLYVVDGVPNAPFNPSDIESMTVLKDAASAAIYGAYSGSAGVILITTKQASRGKPSIEYNAFAGAKTAWRLPQSLTADKEAEVANLALTNAGKPPLDGWDETKNPYAFVTRTNWMDEIFRTGLIHRHTITVNAGGDKLTALVQGRYEENQGTLINTYAKNISGRVNLGYEFTPKIKFRQEVFLNNSDSRGTETASGYSGTILSAIYMPRSAAAYYDDGTFGGVGLRIPAINTTVFMVM